MSNWETISKAAYDTKRDTDKINYENLYTEYSKDGLTLVHKGELDTVWLKPCDSPSGIVADTMHKIERTLQDNIKIGVISNGVHGIDLAERYIPEEEIAAMKNNWADKRVMLVYEAPSSNLDCSFGILQGNHTKVDTVQHFDPSVRNCLTQVWWRLDEEKVKPEYANPAGLLAQNLYVSLPLFLVRYCGIINLYITNLCRFELYKGFGNKKENVLTWEPACKEAPEAIDIAAKDLFMEEVKTFKPDVILTTSNPYNYLWNNLCKGLGDATPKKEQLPRADHGMYYTITLDGYDHTALPVWKILHPANTRIASGHRLATDFCQTLKALVQAGIISREKAMDLFSDYLTYQPQEKH